MRRLRRLSRDNWYWVHAKAALCTWAILLILYTPLPVEKLLGYLIAGGIGFITAAGIVLSICGLIVSRGPHMKDAIKGIRMEISGLWVAISGPAAYALAQFFLQLSETEPGRIPQIAVFYTICAFLAVRLSIVRGHRKKMGS